MSSLKSLCLFLLFHFCSCRDTIRFRGHHLSDDGEVLLSKDNRFELGFFSPGNSSYRYVGIWYSQSKVSEKTVVWIANRDKPINDTSGVLKLNRYGQLVLYAYNKESNPVWYTNVSHSVKKTDTLCAQLLDTGNLVLSQDGQNGSLNIIWKSFDDPTDTIIPGMKLGWNWKNGIELALTSWKSQDDPGKGDYTYRLDPNRNATAQFFVSKGVTKYWRMNVIPWPGSSSFLSNADEMFLSLVVRENALVKLRLQDSGLLQDQLWNEADHRWDEMWSSPKYPCDWYGHCGANSKCSPDNMNLFECECLPGYEPKSVDAWNRRNGSDGCVRARVGVSKCRNGEGFVKVTRVKDPDTLNVARLRKSMSAKECERECLRDCSCTAYMSLTLDENVDCLTWYDDLRDILVYTWFGRDLYVRVDNITLAEAGNSQRFFRNGMILIPILSALMALIPIIMLACWLLKKRQTKDYLGANELEESKRHPELQFFDLDTLMGATHNFSDANILGQGGFGCVYKGKLLNEQEVAIKRLSRTSGQGNEEFKNEVALIARLQHRNLVKLLGYCIKGEERMLVLEYLPNTGLDYFLFDNTRRSILDWKMRFKIINGIARGVLYLHQDSRLRIIHRDLKISNVLLDAEMDPKISDFGMARIFHGDQVPEKTSRVVGTYGYMSPEYAVFGRFSTKSDVFSLGIILLEIVSGKRNNGSFMQNDSMTLTGHVWQLWEEDRVLDIVDSSLESYEPEEVLRCIQVGLLCIQEDSKDRPAISAVVFMLSGEASLASPNQPAFVFRGTSSIVADDSLVTKQPYSRNHLTITDMEAR